jgi:hypothetical protein
MAHANRFKKLLHGQRGGVVIWFSLLLPVILGLVALAVDLARINLTKVELQNAADAGALAGAGAFSPAGTSITDKPFNWTAAASTALNIAQHNYANSRQITNATVETGYWNLKTPSLNQANALYHGTPVAGDGYVPAVRVWIAIDSSHNNGPLNLFFAPIWNITNTNVQASAVAMVAAPMSGKGLFPFALAKYMLDTYWDSANQVPKSDGGVGNTLELGSSYGSTGSGKDKVDLLTGQWTTFSSEQNDVPFVRNLIDYGNDSPLSVGQSTYIQPGAEGSLYGYVDDHSVGTNVAVFVVNTVVEHAYDPIIGIAAFHITNAKQGQKIVEGYFVPSAEIPGLNAGDGTGAYYGALTAPALVQ